jgi:hypothetical protein
MRRGLFAVRASLRQLGDIRRDPPRLINGLLTRIPDF